MGLYLPVNLKGSCAIACCARCGFKYQMTELVQDPNTKAWVCEKCQDQYDPYRMPARQPENISLTHPRSDADISTTVDSGSLVPPTGA